MSKELKEYIERWFIKADHDLITARTILEYEPLVLAVVCFHCQQAVKKYFKAFLIFHGEENTKTHDLIDLQNKCSGIDNDFAAIDL